MTKANWYNAERVSQPGSVILNAWRAERVQASTSQQNLTVQELANLIGGAGGIGGPAVSETTSMRVSAVYACVALIAGAISTLPMPVYQRTKDGRDTVEHPYFWLLNESPNDDISAAVFWEYLVSSRLFYGDCFAEILRPSFRSSKIAGFLPHHPNRVQPFRDTTTGHLFYRVTPLIGAQYTVHPADMIHVPSLGFDGLRSPSPITYAARQAVGTALSADEYNSRFFTNGARPDFAITAAGTVSKDQADMIRATWNDNHAGVAKSHMPAVLMGGLDIKQLSLSAADSQILATSMFQVEQIARVLGVPPHMIGHTDKATSWGAGVENMGRGFVKFTLKRDLVKFEQEFNRKLWPVRERLFVRFDLADIERGDLKSENEALRIALGRAGEPGWMTQNEVRKQKNMPPKDGGDELLEIVAPAAPAAQTTETKPDDQTTQPAGA